MAAALVATEDQRFYSEPGIDLAGGGQMMLGRLGSGSDQGGSTLYQRLATILSMPGRSGLLAEGEQVLLGIKLDLNVSKAQILQVYAALSRDRRRCSPGWSGRLARGRTAGCAA